MKTKLQILSICAFLFLAASCKKEYTCDCTVNTSVLGTTTTTTASSSQGKLSKKDAKAAKTTCEGANGTVSVFFSTVTTSCKQVAK